MEKPEINTVISWLEGLADDDWADLHSDSEVQNIAKAALTLLEKQNEVIVDLLNVGYPHNFQREEPWIVRYMYEITDVVRKAYELTE